MALSYPHYLYALIEREYVVSGKNIIKIGRTSNGLNKRMGQYPNGSLMIISIPIDPNQIANAEKHVLQIAKQHFIHAPFYGSEYFEGDIGNIFIMMCLESQHFLAKKEHVIVEIEKMILNQTMHINNKNKHKIRKPNQSRFQLPLPQSYQSLLHS